MANHKLSRSEKAIINLFTSALAWGWPVLLAFFATPFIVRGLGDDAYGIRGLVVSITGYFALLDLGLNGAVTKYLAEYHVQNKKSQVAELLGTTLTTFTVFGLIGGAVIWMLATWFSTHLFTIPLQFQQESVWAFRLTGVGFFLSMITWWGSSIPTGLQRFDVFNGISIGFGTVTTLSTVAAVYWGYGLLGVVWANLISNVIAILAYLIATKKLLPGIPMRFSFQKAMFKRTVLFGLHMVAFRIFSLFFAQLDTLLIGRWIGVAAITFYTVPQQIAQLAHGINGKMMQIIFPMVSEFSALGDKRNMDRVFARGLNLCLFIGLAAAVPLAVVAAPLLGFWISPEMASRSTGVMELLVFTFLLAGITAHTTSFLGGINCPEFISLGSVVGGVCAAIFYLLLIKPFGITGAALGKLIGVILTVAYYLVVCRWKGGMSLSPLVKIAIRNIGIALAVGAPLYYFVTPLIRSLTSAIFIAVMTAGIYGLVCWVVGVLDAEEKNSLKGLVKRLTSTAQP